MSGTARHVACCACRERKIRCDGAQPSCQRCTKHKAKCIYTLPRSQEYNKEEVSRVLTTLNRRLEEAEAKLAGQNSSVVTGRSRPISTLGSNSEYSSPPNEPAFPRMIHSASDLDALSAASSPSVSRAPWSSLDGGREDPSELIPSEMLDELRDCYFKYCHHAFPMVDKGRYLSKTSTAMAEPAMSSLSYAIWLHGSLFCANGDSVEKLCYNKAREHLQRTEVDVGTSVRMNVETLQGSLLIAMYEFKRMYFSRAWITLGRAVRTALIMGLHRMDPNETRENCVNGVNGTNGTNGSRSRRPSKSEDGDWIDIEEKRRTFWSAFILDRFSNIGTDWPMMIDEKEISTYLPATDSDTWEFGQSSGIALGTMLDVDIPAVGHLSPFTGVVVMTALCGRCVTHLASLRQDRRSGQMVYDFWSSHCGLDQLLSATYTHLCNSLAMTSPMAEQSVAFVNLVLHTSYIYLHEAAVTRGQEIGLAPAVIAESEMRCKTAAMEIANIVRLMSPLNILPMMNLFTPRCLYAAARVCVNTIKRLTGDARLLETFQFLLGTLNSFQGTNPLVTFFVNRVSRDLEDESPEPPLISD